MRIRTIKPEFFKHDGIAALSPLARILFIGLWSLADREGRLEDRAKRIKIEVLPYDECEVESLLCELCAGNFIFRYECDDLRIIQIHNFERHQRITGKEAETDSRFPEFNHETCSEWMGKQWGNNGEAPETTGREGKGKERKEGIVDAPVVFPSPLDTVEFKTAWTSWLAYRREAKLKAYKPTSLKTQLNTLAGWGHDAAVAAIYQSIRQGWQGLFEPKQTQGRLGITQDHNRNPLVDTSHLPRSGEMVQLTANDI